MRVSDNRKQPAWPLYSSFQSHCHSTVIGVTLRRLGVKSGNSAVEWNRISTDSVRRIFFRKIYGHSAFLCLMMPMCRMMMMMMMEEI